MSNFAEEVKSKKRFRFGQNWNNFISLVNTERIVSSEESLKKMLGIDSMEGKRFLDIGSGSGLFSLAAKRLGASVYSFDYDPDSVSCTRQLRDNYYKQDKDWVVEEGSVLDCNYLSKLGEFDIVYSWGVLHHTGSMWNALDNASKLVKKDGLLFIAIYNKQPFLSSYWKKVKSIYNKVPSLFKMVLLAVYLLYYALILFMADIVRAKNPFDRYSGKDNRGMSLVYDVKDWIGGYPFEVASPEEIFRFYRDRGFNLIDLKTCAGKNGCNEFVFKRM